MYSSRENGHPYSSIVHLLITKDSPAQHDHKKVDGKPIEVHRVDVDKTSPKRNNQKLPERDIHVANPETHVSQKPEVSDPTLGGIPPGAWKPSSHSTGQRSPDLANVPCLTNFYLSQPMGNMRNQRMNESIVNDEWVNMVG